MTVDSRWLSEIVKLMISHPRIGIVQCSSISMWDRVTFDSSMNYLDPLGYSYGYVPTDHPQEVFFAEGMAFALKRALLDEIGGLDDYYFMEYDDMDFSWRARLAGYSVYFLPSAIVYHARGGTVGRTYFERPKNVELYTRNHIVTLMKNHKIKNLVKVLPPVLAIEIGKIFYLMLITKNLKVAYAATRGVLEVLKDMRIVLTKRYEIRRLRALSDRSVTSAMHRFNPGLLIPFLAMQAKGQRFIMRSNPPICGLEP